MTSQISDPPGTWWKAQVIKRKAFNRAPGKRAWWGEFFCLRRGRAAVLAFAIVFIEGRAQQLALPF